MTDAVNSRLSAKLADIKKNVCTAYQAGPLTFLLSAMILAGGIAIAAWVTSKGYYAVLLNVVLHILPAFLIAISNAVRSSKSAPPWPRWLATTSLVIAAIPVLVLPPRESLGKFASIAEFVVSFTIAPAFILLVLVAILPALVWIAGTLGRMRGVGRLFQRWLPAPNLYVLVLTLVNGTLAYLVASTEDYTWQAISFLFFAAVSYGLSIYFRKSLFSSDQQTLLWRVLPHVPAWLDTSLLLVNRLDSGDGLRVAIVYGIPLLTGLALPILAANRLRDDPVSPPNHTPETTPESIRSKVAHYVDVHDRSARLVESIGRADAGVFGITGVRGAGKSALTRHVLSVLAPHYFTLEITAPVRHDQGHGFFVSVCKAVCSKTLEELEPIVTGTRVARGEKVWDKIRIPLLMILGIMALGSLTFISSPSPNQEAPVSFRGVAAPFSDPLIGFTVQGEDRLLVAQAERAVTDDLLGQIARIIDDEAKGHGTGAARSAYLLVPATDYQGFWLLPTNPVVPLNERLRAYRTSIESGENDEEFISKLIWRLNTPNAPKEPENRLISIRPFVYSPAYPILTHFQPYLLHHLRTTPQANGRQSSNREQQLKPIGLDSPLPLILVLRASFHSADPKLEFDSARLRQFNDTLRLYRRGLDGNLGVNASPGTATRGVNDSTRVFQSPFERTFGAMAFWLFATLFLLTLASRYVWQGLSGVAHAVVNHRYLDLYAEAGDFLEQLSYQANQESTAGLSWRGISLGRKRTLAARDLTLPGLTARYLRFLEKLRVAYNGKVVIAIDELDKIHDPEQVKALLVEIKGALFAEGTYYLISISEDAARSFRRRLASGRDIFESTFDEVVEVRQMRVDAALSMLQKLEDESTKGKGNPENQSPREKLPTECMVVAALFGGGIPREIIRARRVLSYASLGTTSRTPRWAALTLLREELEHWAAHIGEANVSGMDAIRLSSFARQSIDMLAEEGDVSNAYAKVWVALRDCRSIIDPTGLSIEEGAPQVVADEKEKLAKQEAWQLIKSDLQTVLRLMILTHLSELISTPKKSREEYEEDILACHRALADKPALAESMLESLRGRFIGGGAAVSQYG